MHAVGAGNQRDSDGCKSMCRRRLAAKLTDIHWIPVPYDISFHSNLTGIIRSASNSDSIITETNFDSARAWLLHLSGRHLNLNLNSLVSPEIPYAAD